MEAADTGDPWRCRPSLRAIQDDLPHVSFKPPTSSSASDCSSPQDKSTTTDGPNPHLPQDAKWWLLLRPDLGQQLNTLEAELSSLSGRYGTETAKYSKDHQLHEEFSAPTCMKDDTQSSVPPPSDHHSQDLEFDSLNCLAAGQAKKHSPEMELLWMGGKKAGPWWRSAGKDELASLVAQKSLEHIENCDLPQPQKKHFREQPSNYVHNVDRKSSISSTVELISEKGLSTQEIINSLSMDEIDSIASDSAWIRDVLDGTFSGSHSETVAEDQRNPQKGPENNYSTSQLLEALCHSQTRAREAEEAAQQAYTEKEHIVTLFFRQASQLFAYRQWIQLLQLESFYLQLKNRNLPAPDLSPGILPWVPQKGKTRVLEAPHKTGKRGHGKGRSAVGLAVGLGLAGAGFLLGWTMGWFLFSP
ncbi:uncharacterized protein LOC116196031 isoform X2 [Punica granatum]|uniref:Uncharacterized protein LOC116196031 isoform X2 n=1 Tax=Punica granatum TaxID=22663 RepID=A0A6P8CEF2_PUNGR|nr:uncharacterized protein LOC116196031 isoform X2 [Punica granatum]